MKHSILTFKAVLVLTLIFSFYNVSAQSRIYSTGTVQQTYKPKEEPKKQKSTSHLKGIEIAPLYGYQLNGKVNGYRATFNMKDAANYGVAISMRTTHNTHVEFAYTNSKTTGVLSDFVSGDTDTYNMNINYFQIGGIRDVLDGPIVPYGTASLGVGWFNMKDAEVSDHVAFSAALGGGVKFFLSDHIGIRLQGRLLLPMYFSGGGLFIGGGSGGASGGVSVSTGVIAAQGDFSGGLIFRF
ncbi:hypothetical protein [Carboxylicivirga sp. N1Y90]|uniref:hypothetical protein n=1 Tax=Carboxylicivirga fragile TaxID=3417571 RepID=UPI003D32B842|nr:hypothetical protein [Marinilabiliaceae bacterium N1Y90]